MARRSEVVLLVGGEREGTDLLTELRTQAQSARCVSADAFITAGEHEPVSCVVLLPSAVANTDAGQLVVQFRSRHFMVPVLAVVSSGALSRPRLARLVSAGLDELHVITTKHTDWQDLAASVRRHARLQLPEWLAANLMEIVPRPLHSLVGSVLRGSCRALTVENVAAHFSVNRSTLDSKLRRHGAPTAKRLISLCRMAYVCAVLDNSQLTAARTAALLDFSDEGALRMHVRRSLGTNITGLRNSGYLLLREEWRHAFGRVNAA